MKAIEITTGSNGYPSHLHRGYIDFGSFAEAEAFAKKYNGKVVELRRRDGWQLWESQGAAFEELNVSAETYGDDYSTFGTRESYENDCRNVISVLIADEVPMSDIIEEIKRMENILFEIDNLDEGEEVLLHYGAFIEKIKTHTMQYHEDVWTHTIGVEIEGYNDIADAECE